MPKMYTLWAFGGGMIAIRIPVYGGELVLHRDRIAFERDRQARMPGATTLAQAHGRVCELTYPDGGVTYLVGAFEPHQPSALVHELAHVAVMTLGRAGIDARSSNGEPLCYLLGELCRLCGVDS